MPPQKRHFDGVVRCLVKLVAVDGAARDDGEAPLEGDGMMEQRGGKTVVVTSTRWKDGATMESWS